MPLLLTTAFNPGDLDKNQSYTHAKIVRFAVDLEQHVFELDVRYGHLVAGSFVAGVIPPTRVEIRDQPRLGTTAYTDLIASQGGQLYGGVALQLYTYLVTNELFLGVV
jgi:hypothetical protein